MHNTRGGCASYKGAVIRKDMRVEKQRMYLVIDLKSFYASVEAVERGLDPMTTNLVVADPERTDKTICLAVTPAMKKLGVKNRCRLFEIPKNIEYIKAVPRMQLYLDYSGKIYGIYLKYISKDDIHVYSIDEAFIDVTAYLSLYKKTARELGNMIMRDIYESFGIRASCGIGTNMYLAKVALDITAKHADDFIGYLDEELYRKTLWNYRPLSDFWMIGPRTEKKLARYGIHTMGDIARADEDFLYRLFGIDAEILIDHSKGIEPVTMSDIKGFKAKSNSMSSGQVLMCDYSFEDGKTIAKEMMQQLCFDMSKKGMATKSVTLHIGYSNKLKKNPAHSTVSLYTETNLASRWVPEIVKLYEKIVDKTAPVRRFNITCNGVTAKISGQISMFDEGSEEKERELQNTMLEIKERFGKNAIFHGLDLTSAATALERNRQIGGHKANG